MEYLIKGSFIKVSLNIISNEIYSEIRQEVILLACSKIGILKVGLVIVAFI